MQQQGSACDAASCSSSSQRREARSVAEPLSRCCRHLQRDIRARHQTRRILEHRIHPPLCRLQGLQHHLRATSSTTIYPSQTTIYLASSSSIYLASSYDYISSVLILVDMVTQVRKIFTVRQALQDSSPGPQPTLPISTLILLHIYRHHATIYVSSYIYISSADALEYGDLSLQTCLHHSYYYTCVLMLVDIWSTTCGDTRASLYQPASNTPSVLTLVYNRRAGIWGHRAGKVVGGGGGVSGDA